MAKRHQLSKREREQRRCQDRERLKRAAEELLCSEGWTRWVRVRALFRSYSAGNCMLLALQCHERGLVPQKIAGFRTWLRLGRCVRRGEVALRILAPVTVKQCDEQGEDTDERRVFFRTAFVFDVSQTDPLPDVEPAPLTPPSLGEIEGDSHIALIPRLEALARGLGYQVIWTAELPGRAKGLCRRKQRQIEVLTTIAPNQGVSVLIPWRKHRVRTFGMGLVRTLC